jgi:hypothetical protein
VFENDGNQSRRVCFPFKPFCTQLFPCAETEDSSHRKREFISATTNHAIIVTLCDTARQANDNPAEPRLT